MNTIGEMKDIYVIARHVGIQGERIDRFLKAAEMAGYVMVRKEPQQSAAPQTDSTKE